MTPAEAAVEEDTYVAPKAITVESPHHITVCPVCRRDIKKHSTAQLLECMEAQEEDEDEEEPVAEDLDRVFGGGVIPGPVSREQPRPRERQIERPPAITTRNGQTITLGPPVEDGLDLAAIAAHTFAEPEVEEPKTLNLANGEVDYEALAAAMRRVIEKERDEVVKRGGPLEKQNAELKGRIADLLEECDRLRKRAHAATTRANTLQAQLDELVKERRKQRNAERKQKESGNHTRITEISDLLNVVRKQPGWTVTMGGNGHWQIKKDGVFVTDAASSGGSVKVNMATRVKLRKAGLDV